MKKLNLLLALSITLGMGSPCYGLYVMVRSGFGELKQDRISDFRQERGCVPSWEAVDDDAQFDNPDSFVFENASIIMRAPDQCTLGDLFNYKGHYNLSVALGRRFNVFDTGALGIEIEILGAYAHYNKKRNMMYDVIPYVYIMNFEHYDEMDAVDLLFPDFFTIQYRDMNGMRTANMIPMYLKNQRILGAQANIYWEQYILDWLSAGIGGGIGCAYVCTKFTTLEHCMYIDCEHVYNALIEEEEYLGFYYLWKHGGPMKQGRKYAHSGALLYNFMCFVRAEKFETLFEVGYRHIGLHQIFDNKIYGGLTIKKLANMHSDQIYFGIGRTF